ncbi:MAG: DUF1566 domain-containing protein [Proteobacteria bacterium]|nr:DUF1566 domain-containing protein [Pseudomonadota bacterium]MBU1689027.1 DUF1566 domain-containing protein [Pseudomonadota bacterium]
MRVSCLIIFAVLYCVPPVALAGSFADNGNGTVTDNDTGLVWQQHDDGTTRQWEAAISYCKVFSLAGAGDWRLPNIKELQAIIDEFTYSPAIDPAYFPGTNLSGYWSSTASSFSSSLAWGVNFSNGYVHNYDKSNNYYVRCVRGGQ